MVAVSLGKAVREKAVREKAVREKAVREKAVLERRYGEIARNLVRSLQVSRNCAE
jgi:hypothetical protein